MAGTSGAPITLPETPKSTSTPQNASNNTGATFLQNKRNSMLDYFKAKRQGGDKQKGKGHAEQSKEQVPASISSNDKGKGVAHPQPDEPVLNEEDELFLNRIISGPEEAPPPLPTRPQGRSTDAQIVLMQGADQVPLPDAPETPEGEVARAIEGGEVATVTKEDKDRPKAKSNRFSWLRRSSSRAVARNDTAVSLQSAAESLKHSPKPADAKPNEAGQVTTAEAKKEEAEMADVLEQLNLSTVGNRAFSISNESKDLLKQFTLVLKDLVNGVPTAYHDLESLLTNSDSQLQTAYKSLPPFLQELVEKLPEKFGKSLGPEFLAAAAEKPGAKESKTGYLGKGAMAAAAAEKLGVKFKVPALKDLVTKQGTLVALLRSVMQALRTRFPAFLGMNVLWSLALFVLLFVFWYCHKRGKEVRLEKERQVTEQEMAEIASRVAADPAWTPPPGWGEAGALITTRAPEGASIDEVRQGMLPAPEPLEEVVPEGGQASYAAEGSLGRALKEKKDEEEAQRRIKETEAAGSVSTHHPA